MNRTFTCLVVAGALTSCSTGPEPLQYGKDVCEQCRMMIMDPAFGAEIVTARGKIFRFDAAECMLDYLQAGTADPEKDRFLTTDMAAPRTLIDARTAFYVIDPAFRSPMGGNIASFTTRPRAENSERDPASRVLTWDQLLQTRRNP